MIRNLNSIFNYSCNITKRYYTTHDKLGRGFLKNYKDVKSLYSTENIYRKINNENKKLLENIKSPNTIYLSKLITQVESTREDHQEQSRYIISYLQSLQNDKLKSGSINEGDKNKTFRIGITGPPGAGKSTFIESFGKHLTSLGNKVAVLAIDPSSIRTGGSIMGDKTRMQMLSVDPNAYVRPSATRGFLGGITKGTSDTIILCENAGFNIIIVETVGVGQSEVSIENLVDVFCLIVPPANGDELQGLKKGISELADLVVVNKADGDLLPKARFTVSEYLSAFKIQRPKNHNWIPKVLSCSSVTKEHIDNVWKEMLNFKKTMIDCGDFNRKRSEQKELFMKKLIEEELSMMLLNNEEVQRLIPYFEQQVRDGIVSPALASNEIIKTFLKYERNKKDDDDDQIIVH